MKNFTKHFLRRWVERKVGIKTEREITEYINNNKEQIEEDVGKMFTYADHVYTGQIGNNVTRHFYLSGDTVLITNTDDNAFITVYEVDLGFPEELNRQVRRGLVDEIKQLTAERDEQELENMHLLERTQSEIDNIEESIAILKEQQENLENDKKFKEEEVKNIKSKTLNTNLDIKKYTLSLVNSKEYRDDLQIIK